MAIQATEQAHSARAGYFLAGCHLAVWEDEAVAEAASAAVSEVASADLAAEASAAVAPEALGKTTPLKTGKIIWR